MSASPAPAVNDFVIRFANVNGTGSASANRLFAHSLFRMGIPVAPKNIFPSNIQGLPTWYEVRVNEDGHLGCRGGVDFMVAVNPQSMRRDYRALNAGGYFLYDSTKPPPKFLSERDDVVLLPVPLMDICIDEYADPRQRQLFKNIVCLGALGAFLDMDMEAIKKLIGEQFAAKPKLIEPNHRALDLGRDYAAGHFQCPLSLRVEAREAVGEQILIDGNTALALGAIYGGATVAAWYPITPSTSMVDAFDKHVGELRPGGDGERRYAVVQAEDELAAIGVVIGAGWNGARAFTATSGPGVSLMSEFLGLAYFAEVPAVLFNIQRAGPSTGMPTRTQQSDVLCSAYASHGDTRQALLIPSTPAECFEFSALAFDLAEELQTPIIVLSDLDLGMNDNMSSPLQWSDERRYQRGKVLGERDLEAMAEEYGRYLDVDGDGVCYRTLPGAHPSKGAFFTRGTSRDRYATYTEDGGVYEDNMRRLLRKWDTIKGRMPEAEILDEGADDGALCFGSSWASTLEAAEMLRADGVDGLDLMRVRAFPFGEEVAAFCARHRRVFVVEQNRDAQMRALLMNECGVAADKLIPVLHFDGTPITALAIRGMIGDAMKLAEAPAAKRASR